jgi:branched-chain amino acid transport system permease protein
MSDVATTAGIASTKVGRLVSRTRARGLITRPAQELHAFPSRWSRIGLLVLAVAVVALPYQLTDNWLQVLTVCGCFAIAAIGLNLLSGFTGQVSLGHAFFLAVGGYVAANIGDKFGMPLVVWILAAAVIGAALGALIGPFALRLQGNYLAIITIALLFLSEYLFKKWTNITGGGGNLAVDAPISIGPVNFAKLDAIGFTSRSQGVFWLVWGLVALCALLARNLVRSRAGRAMQAVRDRDLAAEVIGVSLLRYKLGAFAVSSAFAGVGGALYLGVVQRNISASSVSGIQGFVLSITFVAIIIAGGMGSVSGSIVGALIVQGLPQVLQTQAGLLPFVGDGKAITLTSFNNLLFGLLIVVFLLFEPQGIAAMWRRTRARFAAWPFST